MVTRTLWEYKVIAVGGWWGTNAEKIEAALNELGQQGWEVIGTELPHNSGKIAVIAKRPLSPSEQRRRRELPES